MGSKKQIKGSAIKETYVHVLNKNGQPLMPTTRCGHVRKLLDNGHARVVSTDPFTIQLAYDTPNIVQGLRLGIDPGRENIGLAVATKDGKCVYLGECDTRNRTIKKSMSIRANSRRGRRHNDRQKRQRKALRQDLALKYGSPSRVFKSKRPCLQVETRYPTAQGTITQKVIRGKESRFANRKKKATKWQNPSQQQLLQMHLLAVQHVRKILPISEIVLERGIFNAPELQNLAPHSEPITKVQSEKCLLCGAPAEHKHHIVPKSKGGSDTPENLIGLCKNCHIKIHTDGQERAKLEILVQGRQIRDRVHLLKWVLSQLAKELRKMCSEDGLTFQQTRGFQTKLTREAIGAGKGHAVDAFCTLLSLERLPATLIVPRRVHTLKRYKKKSANVIARLHNRKYYDGENVVAVGRRRAFEQEERSLEEHMVEFAETHTTREFWDHLQHLTVKRAKREYTHRKNEKLAKESGRSTASMRDMNGNLRVFHPGDTVLYKRTIEKTYKSNGETKRVQVTEKEVFIVESIDVPRQRLLYKADGKTKRRSSKFCCRLKGGALVCTGTRDLTEIE